MSDIIERLEGPLSGINRAWVLEAADTIRQLRVLHKAAEAREWEALTEKKQDHILMKQTVAEFEADNKELRGEIKRLEEQVAALQTEIFEAQLDIEWLRTALQPFAKMYAAPGGELDKAIAEARFALERKR